jgi:RNase P subunit RPR2|tara:strand:+ start:2627 stop:2839 length:213 start_codon:yes stop_codon:yes gene_type:complete
MELNKTNKKWYCKICIKPEIVNTPYILTEDEVASISVKCASCGEIYLTEHKKILWQDGETFVCARCASSK